MGIEHLRGLGIRDSRLKLHLWLWEMTHYVKHGYKEAADL